MIVLDDNKVFSMFDVSIDADSAYADSNIDNAVQELAKVKRQIKLLQDNEKALSDKIKQFMDNKEKLIGLDGTIIATYKECAGGTRLDTDLLKTNYLDAYSACLVQAKGYKRLNLK